MPAMKRKKERNESHLDNEHRSKPESHEGLVDFRVAKQLLVFYLLSKYPKGLKGSTRLQKLVYLLEKEAQRSEISPFAFRYYHYGPYSSELTDLVTFLASKNLVEVRQYSVGSQGVGSIYQLTEAGQDFAKVATKVLQEEILEILDETVNRYGHMYLKNLVDTVYPELKDKRKDDILIKQRINSLFRKEPLLDEEEESDLEDLYLLNYPQFSRVLDEAMKEAQAGRTKEWRKFFATL